MSHTLDICKRQMAKTVHMSKGVICLFLGQVFALSASAVDLGHPLILSKQGEPLKIEIPLPVNTLDDFKGLQAGIASASTYQGKQLGEDASALGAIGAQARLAQNKKGQSVILVSSDKPIHQSFLSLLLELQWSSGSELKEMGILLDSFNRTSALKDNAIVVSAGDTASAIAQQYAVAPMSYEQMLIALLRTNPKSFVHQNINRLKANAVLTMPSQQEALSISTQQAKEELKAQNLDFELYRQSLAEKIKHSNPSALNAAQQSASGLISPKAQAPTTSNQDQLKLSKPGSKSAKSSEQTAKELQTQQTLKESSQVQQNLKELGQIAEQSASSSNASEQNGLLSSASPSLKSRVSLWLQDPLTPVIAGFLFGVLVLLTLWKTKDRTNLSAGSGKDIDPLSRPSSIFDLETPIPSSLRARPLPLGALGPEVLPPQPPIEADPEEAELEAPHPNEHLDLAPGSLKDHVNIDFDLELPTIDELNTPPQAPEPQGEPAGPTPMETLNVDPLEAENPLQVRFDLAQELWQVGQHHTARAIAQEVASQASGALHDQIQAWLTQRQ